MVILDFGAGMSVKVLLPSKTAEIPNTDLKISHLVLIFKYSIEF